MDCRVFQKERESEIKMADISIDTKESIEMWQMWATAWELMALSFRYPDEVLIDAVVSGEWADAARELADALEFELPEGFEEDACAVVADGSQAFLHALRAEATRLFVGAPSPVCSPYEGVWRAADDGVKALLFVNPHSMEVERFCKACGLGRPEGTNEPLDHVSTECELLEYLALRAAGLLEEGEENTATSYLSSADFPGGSPEVSYRTFFDEHVCMWMPRFAASVAENARHPFYRAAAMFLAASLSKCNVCK